MGLFYKKTTGRRPITPPEKSCSKFFCREMRNLAVVYLESFNLG